jgi:Ca2+-binding RTX toxin-like protein
MFVVVLVGLLVAGLGGVALARVLEGNDRPNKLIGTNQDDTLSGKGANDFLCGENGDDTYFGGKGPDLLVDSCTSNDPTGNDRMQGGPGTDGLIGDRGRDRIDGGPDTDFIAGGPGGDRIDAGDGHDILGKGTTLEIIVFGDGGNDHIRGGKGNDGLAGSAGEDEILGEEGDDVLFGVDGEDPPEADLVDGGRGRDVCFVDDLDVVRNCERIIEVSVAAEQRLAEPDAARAREAFETKYGLNQ